MKKGEGLEGLSIETGNLEITGYLESVTIATEPTITPSRRMLCPCVHANHISSVA